MSDTPRTDKESFLPHDSKYKVCDSDFARQLERELNAANDRIKRLEEEGDDLMEEDCIYTRRRAWKKTKEAKL
jgi:hypothetical protein